MSGESLYWAMMWTMLGQNLGSWSKIWSKIATSLGGAAVRLLNVIALSLLLACSASSAQQVQPKITPLMEAPISGQPDKEFVLLSIEWPPGSTSPWHTHPGDEYGTVITGSYAVKQGNGEWKTYTAGETWHVPAGVVHEPKTVTIGTKTIDAYIVEKGKPLIQPVTRP
jgi:quercetin dioxygenase-like cupin family protein